MPKLDFPLAVGLYNSVIRYDVDLVCVLLGDEVREHSTDDWGHTTEVLDHGRARAVAREYTHLETMMTGIALDLHQA